MGAQAAGASAVIADDEHASSGLSFDLRLFVRQERRFN